MDLEAWLLDPAEPAVRAQALVALRGLGPEDPAVRAARAEAAHRGAVAALLEGLEAPADHAALYGPKYRAPYHRLVALAEMGAPGDEPRVAALLARCLDVFGKPDGGFGRDEGHLCVTGNLVRAALLLGRGGDPRVGRGLAWLVGQQLPDGGWHCWPERFHRGTPDAWEALGAFAAVPPASRTPGVRAAAARGVAFLLDQGLGLDAGYAPWRRLHFPRHYYYDVLVGLELATALGDPRDARLGPALGWLAGKRRPDGTWTADAEHPDLEGDDYVPQRADVRDPVRPLTVEPPGQPSRWLTLRARTVVRRAGRAPLDGREGRV